MMRLLSADIQAGRQLAEPRGSMAQIEFNVDGTIRTQDALQRPTLNPLITPQQGRIDQRGKRAQFRRLH